MPWDIDRGNGTERRFLGAGSIRAKKNKERVTGRSLTPGMDILEIQRRKKLKIREKEQNP